MLAVDSANLLSSVLHCFECKSLCVNVMYKRMTIDFNCESHVLMRDNYCVSALSTQVQVSDRPITQQGLGGLKTAAGRGINLYRLGVSALF
jgi:hypothetical protein